ncbi:MAG: Methionine-tRNA ligase [Parcubacteria group bacterium GW2011_GWA2_47_10]|nr:MAG: Methionine-tRNA ligase [Parcubacteria group bacterium GW2011_GWA2_47_10]
MSKKGYHKAIAMSIHAKEKFYITTAIDYANAKPHIGHALEKIQADVFARYYRIKREEVFFLTGSDEHGVKIVRAAEAAGKDQKAFVDGNTEAFKNLKNILNLSWDRFIRTSDVNQHWPGAQKLWTKIFEAGDLYKKKYRGLYCIGHEAFVTEKDLEGGICRDHKKAPEAVEEENWFFRLSKYSKEIELKIKNDELRIIPNSRKNEILALCEQGLDDVSFSRPRKDLSWGIPVPNDPEHTMYVWCDALANYITAVGYENETPEFKKWWPADMHVIGKDILRFHAAIWPGMLLSAGLPLPKSVFVHGFITVEREKMSKTVGNIIGAEELIQKYGTDPVRYYLLREIPSYEDGDFSYKKFEERYNGDLANGIGNLVSRVATIGQKLGNIPFNFAEDIVPGTKEKNSSVFALYDEKVAAGRLNEALGVVWELVGFADRYINEQKPWAIKDEAILKTVIINASWCIGSIGNLLAPFLPETSERILSQIKFSKDALEIKKEGTLFPRLKTD